MLSSLTQAANSDDSSGNRHLLFTVVAMAHRMAAIDAMEAAMGALAEASIPKHLRWIPKGMDVRYTAKATSDITAIAEVAPGAWENGPELPVTVTAYRDDGTVVVEGTIHLWVTEKPARE